MYNKKTNLLSIPETNEYEDSVVKWVPKKKHEVLKAKYKCLKKLFQIYDASVIGILPENVPEDPYLPYEEPQKNRRKRSHRTKSDACAGTNEVTSGDGSLSTIAESPATAVIRDLNLQQYCSTQVSKTTSTISKTNETNDKSDKSTQESKEDVSTSSDRVIDYPNVRTSLQHVPCLKREMQCPHTINNNIHIRKRYRPSRFQSFVNRIFGLKPDEMYSVPLNDHVYAVSDNNISNIYKKRKRRGLRFRRRRLRVVHSEASFRDLKSPLILSYVQTVQRNCLNDANPRQCPILGCNMICYGIINYNDHLNLCHFPERRYFCHYCHEGFSSEYETIIHENEHIGITKMAGSLQPSPKQGKVMSNTQTDPEVSKTEVPEEKLKKIVSFFDKISDPDQVFDQMKKKMCSKSNSESFEGSSKSDTTGTESKSSESEKGLLSCVEVPRTGRKCASTADSEATSNFPVGHRATCRFCGENFDFRRQLSLHVDLEHRVHDKFSKFHSCPGIVNIPTPNTAKISLEDGRINVQSLAPVGSLSNYSDISRSCVNCEASNNVVYYTSVESLRKKPSVVGNFVQKIRSYKWEPNTKVIHV